MTNALYLTGVHFRGELQHVGHVGAQKNKCRPIRTQEIGGVRLQEELYASSEFCEIFKISSVSCFCILKISV